MTKISTRIERIVAGLVLGVAFLVMASIIVPHDTQATPSEHAVAQPDAHRGAASNIARTTSDINSTDAHEGLFEIGSIESTCYLVRIYTGEAQPLYTVIDITDGRELGTLLTAEEVETYFPDLPINTMEFDRLNQPIGPRVIMFTDPAELNNLP
jgi:hypothetical protein